MNEITTQTYEQWVAEGRPLVQRWKGATLEVCRFLYPKREEFSRNRGRTSESERSWTDFLHDIGLARSTAHDWLAKYDAQQDRLLPPPEPKPRPPAKTPDQIARDNEQRSKRAEAAKERLAEERWGNVARIDASFEATESTISTDDIDRIVGAAKEAIANEQKHAHLNLSTYADNMTQRDMFSAIERYINTVPTLSGQLEAAHNLIKKLKMIANDLQVQSTRSES